MTIATGACRRLTVSFEVRIVPGLNEPAYRAQIPTPATTIQALPLAMLAEFR
jgi:hypothetical protein